MTRIQGTPAFGFERTNWNGNAFYKQLIDNQMPDSRIRQEAQRTFDEMFNEGSRPVRDGYVIEPEDYPVDQIYRNMKAEVDRYPEINRKKFNREKKLAYIPIVGIIFGIRRLKSAIKNEPVLKADRFKHIFRGAIETLSLGFLLAIPDLIVTLKHRRDSNNSGENAQPQ